MRIAANLLLVMLVLLAVAGCSRNQTAPPASGPAATKGIPKSAAPTPGSGEKMTMQDVNVQLGEWFIKLSPATAKPGMINFAIKNVGKVAHAFAIQGQGVKQESGRIAPGAGATMMITLKPGTYQTWCPVGDHKSKGMQAEFTVK